MQCNGMSQVWDTNDVLGVMMQRNGMGHVWDTEVVLGVINAE